MITSRRVTLITTLGAVVFSPSALAHEESGWLHGLTGGAALFASSVQYLLPVVTVALLAGHHGRPPVVLQATTLTLGLLIGLSGLLAPGDPLSLALFARGHLIVLGLLMLADMRLHAVLIVTLCLLTGGVTGLELKVTSIANPWAELLPSVGFVTTAVFIFLIVGLVSNTYRAGWQCIAIRVAGSWIAAIAAIDIAFMIGRPG